LVRIEGFELIRAEVIDAIPHLSHMEGKPEFVGFQRKVDWLAGVEKAKPCENTGESLLQSARKKFATAKPAGGKPLADKTIQTDPPTGFQYG